MFQALQGILGRKCFLLFVYVPVYVAEFIRRSAFLVSFGPIALPCVHIPDFIAIVSIVIGFSSFMLLDLLFRISLDIATFQQTSISAVRTQNRYRIRLRIGFYIQCFLVPPIENFQNAYLERPSILANSYDFVPISRFWEISRNFKYPCLQFLQRPLPLFDGGIRPSSHDGHDIRLRGPREVSCSV